jgi:alpha-beta hydrolase superfamily lysophospholipase
MRYLICCVICFVLAACAGNETRQTTPAGTEYIPPQGSGAAVLILPGAGGPVVEEPFARDLARHGLDVLVVDAENGLNESKLTAAIQDALSSPHAASKKVAVIGFSLGGGYALRVATGLPETVGSVVLYYPVTDWVVWNGATTRETVGSIKVPTLPLAGGADTYLNCCALANAERIEAAAKELSAPLGLVVYPHAKHDFNVAAYAQSYRADDADDAFERTLAFVRRHQGD